MTETSPVIVADDLIAGYLPGVDILNGCSMEVAEGELTGFSIGGSARRVPEAVQTPEQTDPPAPAEPAPDEEAA